MFRVQRQQILLCFFRFVTSTDRLYPIEFVSEKYSTLVFQLNPPMHQAKIFVSGTDNLHTVKQMSCRCLVSLLMIYTLSTLPVVLSRNVHTTSYGGVCTSPCVQKRSSYYWCKQEGGSNSWWDYCSPEAGYDYNFSRCRSKCQYNNSKYKWCWTGYLGMTWGYCGNIIEEFEEHYTRHNVACKGECSLFRGYFQCTDTNGKQDYCSPSSDVTYRGEPCRINHRCGSHGNNYYWCYTDNNWDYCGKIISSCEEHDPLLQGRRLAAQEEEEICRITDSGNRRETILSAIPVSENALCRPSREEFREASNLIARINENFTFPESTRTIIFSATLRLDLQGSFVIAGVRYNNVQIQINGPRQGSSSIAQILLPQDLDTSLYSRYIRRALYTSMRSAYHKPPVKVVITIKRW
ncbi:uncharacterized protein LOC108700682 [Xenopus laevis]|uniref:Uncharacterized protein LOC108700682 n=2 Tax=Xenopus laevis TaxID=8355 RepID=A0A1L8F4C4_XENLA|nr:uncharacterized protein LOC108700682 [Xenopus laevis]OCT66434.1 hypothetical protein XELAEV_18042684mg [Xenopus laevis]